MDLLTLAKDVGFPIAGAFAAKILATTNASIGRYIYRKFRFNPSIEVYHGYTGYRRSQSPKLL